MSEALNLSFSLPRGHTVKAVCESFHLAKDAGFKVVAHMMPDLPNMGLERDTDQFVVSMAEDHQEFLDPSSCSVLFCLPFLAQLLVRIWAGIIS